MQSAIQSATQLKETTIMTTQQWILAVLFAGAVTLAQAQAAPVNLITNGSFEQNSIPAVPGYTTAPQPGWIYGTNPADLAAKVQLNYNPAKASDGSQYVELNGADWKTVLKSDKVSLTANQAYTFSFDTRLLAAYNWDWSEFIAPNAATMSMVISLQHNEVEEPVTTYYSDTIAVANTDQWNSKTFTFTPTANDNSVRVFVYTLSGDNVGTHVYTGIDNVKLVAVPEPAGLALLGLSSVLLLRRRRA